MNKGIKVLIIYAVVAVIPLFVVLVCEISGTTCIQTQGFALDRSGKLYIGKNTRIDVYDSIGYINSIDIQTNRGYAFTIIEGDKIALTTYSTIYYMNLRGEVLSQEDASGADMQHHIEISRRSFTDTNGQVYSKRSSWGREMIVDDTGKEIYRMSLRDYLAKLYLVVFFISMFVIVPIIIVLWRRGVKT